MAEQKSHQVLQSSHNTIFNGVDGEYGKSASLWLDDIERHRERGSSPSLHLRNIDRQLEGDADRWAKNTPSARIAILKGYGEEATQSDVEALYQAITERFYLALEDILAIMNSRPRKRLLYLKQEATEDLRQYYNRTMDILTNLHCHDGNINTLTPLEMSMHEIAVESFVMGLVHRPLCGWLLLQNVLHPSRTLHEVYRMAIVKARIMASEEESEQGDGKEEKEQESREKGQQERKHKRDTELQNSNEAKKLKMTLEVPTATQNPGNELNEPPTKPSPTVTPPPPKPVQSNPGERRYPRRHRMSA